MSSRGSRGSDKPCPIPTVAVRTLGDNRGQTNAIFLLIGVYCKKRIKRKKMRRSRSSRNRGAKRIKKERKRSLERKGGWRVQRGKGLWVAASL